MTIEKLARSEKSADRFILIFEDGSEIRVSASQIADFGLYSGKELAEEEYLSLREDLKLSSSRARAIRMLGSRNLSAREIERRLIGKGESAETAHSTVEWLDDIGAINDTEYAAAIVKHYSGKGYGAARIRDELFRRGIPRDLWDDALAGLDNMEDAAYGFLEKKLRGSCDPDDLRRATDSLCRRGFRYEEAKDTVRRYVANREDSGDEE